MMAKSRYDIECKAAISDTYSDDLDDLSNAAVNLGFNEEEKRRLAELTSEVIARQVNLRIVRVDEPARKLCVTNTKTV